MIFYFSGTGNSIYIADRIAACLDDKTIDMADCVKKKSFSFECKDEDYVGFIFPTYAWSIPYVVEEFIESMELDNIDSSYVFAINNCASSEGNAIFDLVRKLSDKNIKLNFSRTVFMPSNHITLFDSVTEEDKNRIYRRANIKMANIINNILRKKKSLQMYKGILFPVYKVLKFVFNNFMCGTSKFYVKESCVGCGLCSEICNTSAIKMEEGRPIWVSKSCIHCLACINRCPVEAIEYGKATEGKERYVNPFAKFEKMAISVDELQKTQEEETEEDEAEDIEESIEENEEEISSEILTENKEE